MLTNCIAYVKLIKNKKLNTYKAQFAFNVHKKMVGDEIKYVFPVQAKCNYVSGDLSAENLNEELQRVVAFAQHTLRTTNVQIVD
jgi:hypothetical protein